MTKDASTEYVKEIYSIDIVMKDNDSEAELYEILNNLWGNEDIEAFTIHTCNCSYGKGGD